MSLSTSENACHSVATCSEREPPNAKWQLVTNFPKPSALINSRPHPENSFATHMEVPVSLARWHARKWCVDKHACSCGFPFLAVTQQKRSQARETEKFPLGSPRRPSIIFSCMLFTGLTFLLERQKKSFF